MSFFNATPNALLFNEYGPYHILALSFLGIAILLTFIFRKFLRDRKKETIFLIVISVVAFSFELAYHIWNFVNQTDFVKNLIPFELCAISLWMALAMNITKSRKFFEILYFFSLGALVALVFPDIYGYGPDHFRFYHYFFVHSYIVFTITYYIIVHGYRISFKSLAKAVMTLLPLSIIMYIIDRLFNVNYMFLLEKPDIATPLDLIKGTGIVYFLSFALIVIIVFFIFYLPWLFFTRKSSSQD
ncbi:MAG: TIGR02206 family membrane protein [Clostridia bacterium]|nr:TIGR02206 family membrane protein [Clostridia bacterium]